MTNEFTAQEFKPIQQSNDDTFFAKPKGQRVVYKLGHNLPETQELEPLYTQYGYGDKFAKDGGVKISFEPSEELMGRFRVLDEEYEKAGQELARAYFKKDLKLQYEPIVKDGEVSIKVHQENTKVYDQEKNAQSVEYITAGSSCFMTCTARQMWFNKKNKTFGVGLQAKLIVCKHGTPRETQSYDIDQLGDFSWD